MLYNKIKVKIFDPDGKLRLAKNILAGNGRVITESGVLTELSKIADKLENDLPQLEYKMVQLRSQPHIAEYNFVYVGLRPDVEQISEAVDSKIKEQEKEPNNDDNRSNANETPSS